MSGAGRRKQQVVPAVDVSAPAAPALSFQKIVGSVSRFPIISRVSTLDKIFLAHTSVLPQSAVCCSLLLFFKVFVAFSSLFGLHAG